MHRNGENEKRTINNYLHIKGQSVQKLFGYEGSIRKRCSFTSNSPQMDSLQRGQQSTEDEHRSGRPSDYVLKKC